MIKLEDIQAQHMLTGIVPEQIVRIIAASMAGEAACSVYFEDAHGKLGQCMLFRSDEANLAYASVGRPWAFDADAAQFKLAAEAYRIHLAHLFDPMMAVHASDVEPLPHQITAVYEAMLPRQPLRFMLADDPGAGKTIMAGLLMRELLMRADAQRILIIAPGSLVEQWQEEMREKFGLGFTLFGREQLDQSISGNPFDEIDLMVARVDQLARNDDLQNKLRATQWDLIVIDEAHKLSANRFGNKVNRTKRFELGEMLGSITRHFLLMTATPHNGKEDDFQLFMSLLDSDRFYGKAAKGAAPADVSDLMRRTLKEDMLRFDGTKLFPERIATTINYQLSSAEAALYEEVTNYVKNEMQRADDLGGQRKGRVGFALTILQRRLASSPQAIFQSLLRRRNKLQRRVEEEKNYRRTEQLADVLAEQRLGDGDDIWEADDALSVEAYENLEETLVDQATAAQTIQQLEAEILILDSLVEQARTLAHANQDRKWAELSELLHSDAMRESSGLQRKLIIFTEHRDTLDYLRMKICTALGCALESVETIHGGINREARRQVQDRFRSDPQVRILLATDAAGEGVNLQNAHLMVNYDLPWNPNRIEQRFGRIHRIGQTETCHLWNMVAAQTREGEVFHRLFTKLEIERAALGGRVFDILGEVFEDKSLKDLLIEAIRYGDDPARREDVLRVVEGALDHQYLKEIIDRHALTSINMTEEHLFAVREEMEKAQARKLQPYFIRAFFKQAFTELKGELREREGGRYQIVHVPAEIRQYMHGKSERSNGEPRRSEQVQRAYERVCFEKEHVRLRDRPSAPMATLLHAGQVLMRTVTEIMLERHRASLKRGCVLLDPNDDGLVPKLLLIIDHSIQEGGSDKICSQRLQFVEITQDGQATHAGWAPHLDLQEISRADLHAVRDIVNAPWLAEQGAQALEKMALNYAATALVPQHLAEVRARRERHVSKNLAAVKERLGREIDLQTDRYSHLQDELNCGKDTRLAIENTRRLVDDLQARLASRSKQLQASLDLRANPPIIVGGALLIPAGLLAQRNGDDHWCADANARSRIERIAMQAVMQAERELGNIVTDVSAQKCGWDITSQAPMRDGKLPEVRHIEVKGRVQGADTITVTKNEVLYGFNQQNKFILALVLVEGDKIDGPHYIRRPFEQEPDWADCGKQLAIKTLMTRAVSAAESMASK